jgi:hypothetical protein
VGELSWSIKTVGFVNANPDRVLAWWWHPDRRTEFRAAMERSGVVGFSDTVSTEDGVRVGVTKYKDRKGWVHESRTERRLGPDGMPMASEDGSFPLRRTLTYVSPLRYKLTLTCNGQAEFNPKDDDTTEITFVHHHTVVGGTRPNRENIQRSDQEREARGFQELIDRCQADLSGSVASDSAPPSPPEPGSQDLTPGPTARGFWRKSRRSNLIWRSVGVALLAGGILYISLRPSPPVAVQVDQAARAVAAQEGVRNPSSVTWVATDYGDAELALFDRILEDGSGNSTRVYAAEVSGGGIYSYPAAYGPPVTGTVLILILQASNLQTLGYRAADAGPPLVSLGKPEIDSLS